MKPVEILRTVVLLLAVAACSGDSADAEDVDPLTEEELQLALELEAAATESLAVPEDAILFEGLARLADTPSGRSAKSVVTEITLATSPATDAVQPNRLARVSRFEYRTGFTWRTTIDLDAGEAIDIERKLFYPTPLADSERDRAVELARAAREDWQEILDSVEEDEVELTILVPVDSNRRSATYGHRLVKMWIAKPARSSKVLVDLSVEEVIEE